MYSQFKDCPRKFYWNQIKQLSPKGIENRLAAEFGIGIHVGLEQLYKTRSTQQMNQGFISHWNKFEGLCPKSLRTMVKGILILKKYVDQNGIPVAENIISTEASYSMEVDSGISTWKYYGKVDRVIVDSDNSEAAMPVDIKSSSVKGRICTNPNAQIVGYAALIRSTGRQVNRAAFDFLYFRKGRAKEDQYETISIQYEPVSITDEIIEDWNRDLTHFLGVLESCINQDYFPKDTNSCCPFLFLCELGVDYRRIHEEIDLTHDYELRTWNPEKGESNLNEKNH